MDIEVHVGVFRDGVDNWCVTVERRVLPGVRVAGSDGQEALANAIRYVEQHGRFLDIRSAQRMGGGMSLN